LETGLGISTVLFAAWSSSHICVVHSTEEVRRFRDYADARGIDLGHVQFEIGSSEDVLPTLRVAPLDVVFIDGGHGFPTPIIDWYYGSRLLRASGIVVIDDIQLPAVSKFLVGFLRKDPRWERVGGDREKWVAYRKSPGVELPEEWTSQSFLGRARYGSLRTRVVRSARHAGGRALRRVRRG
jgi:hypothetical protein